MVFKLVAGTSPVVVAVEQCVLETDPGMNLEDCDTAPTVCPIVVFPGNWT